MEHATWTALTILTIICGSVLLRIRAARRGSNIYIRRIPGLDAFEEALGRATELGRPILFSPGFAELRDMSTYAGLAVLEHAVRRAAQFGLRIIVPVPSATVFTVTQDAVRDAFAAEGRPERYNPDDVIFLNTDQSAFAAAVTGIMERERVAAAFYFGYYGYESLLMAETGQRVGAVQVTATDAFLQVPFFLAACDYTMFGEELYAASAYLSREPTMLGSLSGQDIGKAAIGITIMLGVVAASLAAFSGGPDGFTFMTGLLGR
jgi:hypothetical protein